MSIFESVRYGKVTFTSDSEYQKITRQSVRRAQAGEASANDLAQIKYAVENKHGHRPPHDLFRSYGRMIEEAETVIDGASDACPMCGTSECRHNS